MVFIDFSQFDPSKNYPKTMPKSRLKKTSIKPFQKSLFASIQVSQSFPKLVQNRSKIKVCQHSPKRPLQEVPRSPREAPRPHPHPRGLKIAPRGSQDPLKRLPRGTEDPTRPLRVAPGMSQDGPQRYNFSPE